ncbi:transcription factor HES-3 [Peromyscus californicus insignis]|uniref:transcription factor HES-3 n=1 Tax=Peromyscus californicus insignis TaxID=564181 RepID=UPI0022A724BE|nr:transcription factor HES-3 [Peromyscus californicus insignis]
MWGRAAKACLDWLWRCSLSVSIGLPHPGVFSLVLMLLPSLYPPRLFSSIPSSPPFPSPGLWPVPSGVDYPSGFQGCLPGVSQRLRRGEDGSGLRCPLVLERRAGSTTDSASPQAVSVLSPCLPANWAPASAAGGSQSPLSPLPLPRGLPESSTGVPAPQPVSNCQTESPRPGLGVWRPW